MGSIDNHLVEAMINNFKRRLQNEDYSSLTPSEEQQMRDIDTSTNEAMLAMRDEHVEAIELLETMINDPTEFWNPGTTSRMIVCEHCEEEMPEVTSKPMSCGHLYCRWCVRLKILLETSTTEDGWPLCLAEVSFMRPMEWTPGVMKALKRGLLAYVKRLEAMTLMNQWASGRRLQLIRQQDQIGDDKGYESKVVHRKCAGCLEEFQSKSLATLSCDHDWCVDCLSENIRQAITSRVNWPPRCCDYFSRGDLMKARDLVSKDLVIEWMKKEEELTSTNPTYCTQPDCGAFIPERNFDEDYQLGTCPLCKWWVCRRCKCPFVEHILTGGRRGLECPSRVGKENEKLITEGAMQKCPECGFLVEKSEGCDHMKCPQCQSDFCYRCGSALAGPFYRCRRECGGGAPAFEEESEEVEEDTLSDIDPRDVQGRRDFEDMVGREPGAVGIDNEAEVAGVRLENEEEAWSEEMIM